MRQLRDRVAVVTGAASGIGRALGLALARRGCHVALVDVESEKLRSVVDAARALGVQASGHVADVASRDAMRALPDEVLDEHGHVHLLVNNAGVGAVGTLEEQSIEDIEWVLSINLWGVIYGCKFFLPHLRREEEAHIVNLSSLFGIIGIPTQSSYNISKFAVRGLSEALLAELAGTAVGVSVVHPGGVRTNIIQASRLPSNDQRADIQARFDRFAMKPEKAAAKILRAVERNQHRVRIGRETYVLDWAKRLFPTATQKLIASSYRRGLEREARQAG